MGANSLSLPLPVVVLLCFLFVVSSSHAACFDDCIKSFTEGSSPSPKAIAQVVGCMTKCALGEGEGELKTTTEELISLVLKLPLCKYQPCYRLCRSLGGSKEYCAKKCKCRLTSLINNDRDQEMTEELISLDDKLMASCKWSICYRACRAVGGGKESCAKNCHCTPPKFSPFELNRKAKMMEEEADDETASAASA